MMYFFQNLCVYTFRCLQYVYQSVAKTCYRKGNIDIMTITSKEDSPQGLKRHYSHIEDKCAILISENTHQNILEEIERRNDFDVV